MSLPREDGRTVLDYASPKSQASLFAVLHHRDFRLVWIGNLISGCGVWAQNLAVGWLILKLPGSTLLLGVYGFASLAPVLALSLIGGTIADRTNRRTVLLVTQTTLMLLALLLGVLTSLGAVTWWQVLAITLLTGSAVALNSPAYQAMIPDLVPADDLTRAIALNSVQFNVARIIGHAAAGFIVAGVGVAGCFFLNAASYLAMLYALWRVRAPSRHVPRDQTSFVQRMREGVGYVRQRPALRALIFIAGSVSLLGLPYFFLVPAFGRDVLGVKALGLGFLTASVSAGALAGGLTVSRLVNRWGKTPALAIGTLLFWIALLTFAFSRIYLLSLGALVIVGFGLVMTVVTINNLLQLLTPAELRGRVMSIHGMAINGMAPLGSVIAGALGAKWSVPFAVGGMAVLGLLASTIAIVVQASRLHAAETTAPQPPTSVGS